MRPFNTLIRVAVLATLMFCFQLLANQVGYTPDNPVFAITAGFLLIAGGVTTLFTIHGRGTERHDPN